jgi:hypothetical protein
MRLRLILPRVEPDNFKEPTVCPYEGCGGRHFEHHHEVSKGIRDTKYAEVVAHRVKCFRCQCIFRVYPQGATRAQISQRVQALAAMLYLLGLSHGAVSLTLG